MKEGKKKEINDDPQDERQRVIALRMQAAELQDMRHRVPQLDLHPEGKIGFHELEAEVEAFIVGAKTDAIRIIPGFGVQGKLKGMVKPWIEKILWLKRSRMKEEPFLFF